MRPAALKTQVEPAGGFRVGAGEAAGAVADLGLLVPLSAALILVNGMDAGAVLLCAGLLYVAAGLWFRVPFPVQPLKALTAIAVAEQLAPGVIRAAGIELGGLLLLISVGGLANLLAKVFTKAVVRALQLGVGILLAEAAYKLVAKPPDVFVGVPSRPWAAALAAVTFVGVFLAAKTRRYLTALAVLVAGVAATAIATHPHFGSPALHLPSVGIPKASAFATAFTLLVIPQLPLTFGNAVVAVNDLSHEYFGEAARRVSPARICVSDGVANVAAGLLGGMPMCHGSGGLTAHYRLGARTAGMNLLIGGTLAGIGLLFAAQVPVLLSVFPLWALAGFLAYTAARHAWLVFDLRGVPLAIAAFAGVLGAVLGNLAVTAAAALVFAHGHTLIRRRLFRTNVES